MAKDKVEFIREDIKGLKDQGLYITIRTIGSAQEGWVTVDGKRALNFCSNNYLGLANHPRMKQAAKKAIDDLGVGPGAVRSIAGTMSIHLELERRLAEFKQVEGAISFQSGFSANLAVIPALMGGEDIIFSDELNHASIIDGCRLSRAKVARYEHCNPDSLRHVIQQETAYRRRLIVSDGVFSMDGDIAPMDALADIADEYGIPLMTDDAHGEGVLGRGGRGIVDHFNVHGRVDIEVGTLSKAFGVMGGYVAGKKEVVEWLRQQGRPFLFSSASTPADVAACIAAVDLLEESTELVDRLWENTGYFKAEMRRLGFDTGRSETPITPIMLGEAPLAFAFSTKLFEEGLFAMALGFPTVPRGRARIRVMLSAMHSQDDLDKALGIFKKVGEELGVI
ncbi:MAG: glycine C-acetyltransferase [Anaerolineae bacterium]|nr:glycine C-acetyltransferase [Anaerolineae bacterium]